MCGAGRDAAIRAGIAMLDGNGDGAVERKEAGKAYGAFKRGFLKGAELLQTMGPMLAM